MDFGVSKALAPYAIFYDFVLFWIEAEISF